MENYLSQARPQLSSTQKPGPQIIEKKPILKPTNPRYDRNYTKEEIALIFSYLNTNSYFQNLKKQHKYVHWMSTEQKRKLLIESYTFLAKSNIANEIQQIQKQTEQNHHFQKIKIVVMVLYGKLYFQGKAFNIGQWVQINSLLHTIVQEKCVCLIFEANIFEAKLNEFNFFHFKKTLFKKYFLQKVGIDFPSKKVEQIVNSLQFHSSSQKIIIDHRKPEFEDPGIYILIKGNFFICDIENKICVGEISEGFVGQESFWGKYRYNLKGRQNNSEFLFCPKELFITCLSEEKYQQLKCKLKQFYEKKRDNLNNREKAIENLYKEFKDSKEKAVKKVKSRINIQQCQQMLLKIRNLKPKWMQEQEKKQKNIKNRRKNIFTQPSQSQKSKRKYFSIKNSKSVDKYVLKEKSPEEKQLFTRHFSSMKTDFGSTVDVTPLNSTRTNNLMNQTEESKDFSRFARTSYYHQGNKTGRSYFATPKKVKSESKFQKSQMETSGDLLDKWDVEYSKKYDRCLSWSVRKEKNLVKVVKFKEKVFPKERTQFFTMNDAKEAINKSFFDLERLRNVQDEEKNKRTFQKVFKQKMLLMDASRKAPLVFR